MNPYDLQGLGLVDRLWPLSLSVTPPPQPVPDTGTRDPPLSPGALRKADSDLQKAVSVGHSRSGSGGQGAHADLGWSGPPLPRCLVEALGVQGPL